MPRKKIAIPDNLDEKITAAEAELADLVAKVKAKKAELKKLAKAKEAELKIAAEKKATEDKEKLVKAFANSEKSIEEVIDFLNPKK